MSGWLELDGGKFAILLSLVCLVWALPGVACSRIAAMRIARDEGVGAGEALGFAASNLKGSLGALLFLAVAIGLFLGCNLLAGLLGSVPVAGVVLQVVLLVPMILSTVILFLLGFGTLVGMPLVAPALATESNGALDAVSRAFSYVYSRFMHFVLYAFLIGIVFGVLRYAVGSMEALLAGTFWKGAIENDTARAAIRGFEAAVALRWPDGGGEVVAWVFGLLFHLCLMGFVAYWAFGAWTAAYFALRREVDGTEDEEIWVAGEDEGGFGTPEEPERFPAPAAPPPPAK